MDYIYDAFISYRHQPTDMKIAAAVLNLIEKQKDDSGRKLHAFRDQNELPTSSDLGGDIHRALEESRFLIAVCSPDYCESRWCMEEIRYFRQLHGNSNANILTILVDGEPSTSFPNVLFHENRMERGSDGAFTLVERELEPLGADVRGKNDRERLKKLKSTEIYRLLAPILGKRYDELYNRAARKRNRIIVTTVSGVAAAALGFGIYSNAMLQRIAQSQRDMYAAQSLRLANESLQQLDRDPSMAFLLAKAASGNGENRMPVELSGTALRSASAQLWLERSEYLRVNAVIPMGSSRSWNFYDFIYHGKCFTVQENGITYVYDSWNGSLLKQIHHGDVLFSKDDKSYLYFDKLNDHQFQYTMRDLATDAVIASNVVDIQGNDLRTVLPTAGFGLKDGGYVFAWGSSQEMDCYAVVTSSGEWSPQATVSDEIKSQLSQDNYFFAMNQTYQIGNYAQVPDTSYQPELNAESRLLEAAAKERMESRSSSEAELEEVIFSYTPDDALMLCYGRFINMGHSYIDQTCRMDIYERTNGKLIYSVEGVAYPGGSDNTLVVIGKHDIQILSYRPELFHLDLDGCDVFTALSPDGQLAAMAQTGFGYGGCFVLARTNDIAHPLVEREFIEGFCDVSEDLRKAAVLADGTLELWNSEGAMLKQWNNFNGQFTLSADGSLLALLMQERTAEIWDTESLQQIGQVEIETLDVPRFAVQGNLLVVWNYASMDLYDIQLGKKTASVQTEELYYFREEDQQRFFTDDGLIMLNSADLDRRTCMLMMIYDPQKGEVVPFYSTETGYAANADWTYDAKTGTLFVQCGDRIYAEQRNVEGAFSPIYTIIPQQEDMILHTETGALRSGYLILNNGTDTEVYRVADGSLYCRFSAKNRYNSQFGLTESGKMVDLRCIGNQLSEIQLSDLESIEQVKSEMMTSSLSVRMLGVKEQERYYIPEEWMTTNGGNGN